MSEHQQEASTESSSSSSSSSSLSSDLPFLVTHWLQNAADGAMHVPSSAIAPSSHGTDDDPADSDPDRAARQDAMDRMRRATRDLAAAFADLGMFGMALNVSCVLCHVCCIMCYVMLCYVM